MKKCSLVVNDIYSIFHLWPSIYIPSMAVQLQQFNGIFLKKPPFPVVGEVMILRIKYAEKNNHCYQIMVIFKAIIPEALLKKQ